MEGQRRGEQAPRVRVRHWTLAGDFLPDNSNATCIKILLLKSNPNWIRSLPYRLAWGTAVARRAATFPAKDELLVPLRRMRLHSKMEREQRRRQR